MSKEHTAGNCFSSPIKINFLNFCKIVIKSNSKICDASSTMAISKSYKSKISGFEIKLLIVERYNEQLSNLLITSLNVNLSVIFYSKLFELLTLVPILTYSVIPFSFKTLSM